MNSYKDDGGARRWAYRYAVLREASEDGSGEGGLSRARELAVFESAACEGPSEVIPLSLGPATARPFSLGESGRWGGGGVAVHGAAEMPETMWRAFDERDADAWRRALNGVGGAEAPGDAAAAGSGVVHGGPMLAWRVGELSASWRRRY